MINCFKALWSCKTFHPIMGFFQWKASNPFLFCAGRKEGVHSAAIRVTGEQDTAPPEQALPVLRKLLLLSLPPSYSPLLRVINFKLGIQVWEPSFSWCFNCKAHPAATERESRARCDPEGAEPLGAAPTPLPTPTSSFCPIPQRKYVFKF